MKKLFVFLAFLFGTACADTPPVPTSAFDIKLENLVLNQALHSTLELFKQIVDRDEASSKLEVVERLRDIEQAISLLNDIVAKFNAGKLAILKPSFEKLCSYPILIEDLKLRDLRRFAAKLEKFETFIKNSCEEQRALFTKGDLILCDKVCLLCQILGSRIFNKQNFEFSAIDNLVDTVIYQPLDWIRKNPDVAIVSAIPVVLGTVALGVVFGDKLFSHGDASPASPIDEKGFYIPSAMHVDGVPDGICSEVSIAKQKGGTCGKCMFTYLMQRYERVEDTQTLNYRESNKFYPIIKNQPEFEKLDFDQLFGYPDAAGIITGRLFPNEILFLHTGISLWKHLQNIDPGERESFRAATFENYYIFDASDSRQKLNTTNGKFLENFQSCIVNMLGLNLDPNDAAGMLIVDPYLRYAYNTVFDKLKQNKSAFIFLAPVLGSWVAHSLAFEIVPFPKNPKNPFKIICYDSLPKAGWREVGAKFIYDFLKDRSGALQHPLDANNSVVNWLNAVELP